MVRGLESSTHTFARFLGDLNGPAPGPLTWAPGCDFIQHQEVMRGMKRFAGYGASVLGWLVVLSVVIFAGGLLGTCSASSPLYRGGRRCPSWSSSY
jgi:hypothetical protein